MPEFNTHDFIDKTLKSVEKDMKAETKTFKEIE